MTPRAVVIKRGSAPELENALIRTRYTEDATLPDLIAARGWRLLRKTTGIALGLALLWPLAPASTSAAEPFEINAIVPVTGYGAFLGKAEVDAFGVVAEFVNRSGGVRGRPVKFVIQDDQSNPQIDLQLANALVAKKASVFLGPGLTAGCNAVAPLAKDGAVVIYCLTPGVHPAEGSYVFSASISTADVLAAAARFFHDRGWHKVAVITTTDASGQDGEHSVMAAFSRAAGEEVVANEHFNGGDISVAAQIARIKSSEAQALIAWVTGSPIATVLRGISEAGLDRPVMIGNGNATFAQMKAYASFLPKELYFSVPPALLAPNQLPDGPVKRAVAAYANAFRAAGLRPSIGEPAPWDSALLVVEAYRRLGLDATPAQIRNFLANIRGWAGVDGTFDFRASPQRGLGIDSAVVVRWDPAQGDWVGVSRYGGRAM